MAGFLTAAEAAARLGVTRATLYAYVSRGLVRACEADDPRRRLYAADAVEQLAVERRRRRRPKEVAKAALDFGAPVLKSAITLIRDGRLWHRGVDAVALAETAELEDIAALLWELPRAAAFGPPASLAGAPGAPAAGAEALLARFAASDDGEATAAWIADPAQLAEGCGALVRRMAAAATRRLLTERRSTPNAPRPGDSIATARSACARRSILAPTTSSMRRASPCVASPRLARACTPQWSPAWRRCRGRATAA